MLLRQAILDDARDIARVDVDTWRATYRDILPAGYLSGLSYESRERMWRGVLSDRGHGRSHFTLVAEDYLTGRVVAFASGGRERDGTPGYRGELYTLYVDPACQRRGLGRRLTVKMAERLARAGVHSMLVWVLAQNPARRFYESLGGRWVQKKPISVGGVTVDEVAYGWPDTRALGYLKSPL
jgi:ribosomal protein S18 acetylase RimI-like enzyme